MERNDGGVYIGVFTYCVCEWGYLDVASNECIQLSWSGMCAAGQRVYTAQEHPREAEIILLHISLGDVLWLYFLQEGVMAGMWPQTFIGFSQQA